MCTILVCNLVVLLYDIPAWFCYMIISGENDFKNPFPFSGSWWAGVELRLFSERDAGEKRPTSFRQTRTGSVAERHSHTHTHINLTNRSAVQKLQPVSVAS